MATNSGGVRHADGEIHYSLAGDMAGDFISDAYGSDSLDTRVRAALEKLRMASSSGLCRLRQKINREPTVRGTVCRNDRMRWRCRCDLDRTWPIILRRTVPQQELASNSRCCSFWQVIPLRCFALRTWHPGPTSLLPSILMPSF